uniref:Uncharacterized protein n=1 Tax=Rhizophora mucronata TaxID=61149 RepID=A0A2P2QE40_RHIMU
MSLISIIYPHIPLELSMFSPDSIFI